MKNACLNKVFITNYTNLIVNLRKFSYFFLMYHNFVYNAHIRQVCIYGHFYMICLQEIWQMCKCLLVSCYHYLKISGFAFQNTIILIHQYYRNSNPHICLSSSGSRPIGRQSSSDCLSQVSSDSTLKGGLLHWFAYLPFLYRTLLLWVRSIICFKSTRNNTTYTHSQAQMMLKSDYFGQLRGGIMYFLSSWKMF